MTWIWITALVIYYVLGISGFVYWWTKDHDLELFPDFFLMLFIGTSGPLTWLIGKSIHGTPLKWPTIILKKKKEKP